MANPQKENGYTPIANEIMEAFAKIRIPGEARQMLDVIIRKTYGFNKKKDLISTSQFITLTGLPNFSIHRARKTLLKMNLITISKNANGVSKFDYGYGLSYSFIKDYHKWTPISKNAHCAKMLMGGMQKSALGVTNIAIHKRHYTKDNITKDNTTISPEVISLQTLWNSKMPWQVKSLTESRVKNLTKRLKDPLFKDNFAIVCDKILASDFLSGRKPSETHPNFKADFDWIINNDNNYVKVLEGKYDEKKRPERGI